MRRRTWTLGLAGIALLAVLSVVLAVRMQQTSKPDAMSTGLSGLPRQVKVDGWIVAPAAFDRVAISADRRTLYVEQSEGTTLRRSGCWDSYVGRAVTDPQGRMQVRMVELERDHPYGCALLAVAGPWYAEVPLQAPFTRSHVLDSYTGISRPVGHAVEPATYQLIDPSSALPGPVLDAVQRMILTPSW